MSNIKTAMVILWLTLTLSIALGSSVLKNKVQRLERRLATINTNIQKDIENIHVLKAEWSHYNTDALICQLFSEKSKQLFRIHQFTYTPADDILFW